MSTLPLTSRLPLIYHELLPDFVGESYPEERFATCDTCVKCKSAASPFLETKCCTYYPSLPNYMVGGVITDVGSGEGRKRVLEIIDQRVGVTPYGLLRPASRRLGAGDFSRRRADIEASVCPYYDAGRCSIWSHREHLCSTFFCYSVGGKQGKAFWSALNEYLKLVEHKLALHGLLRLGWPVEQLRWTNALPDWLPATTTGDEVKRRALWREWFERPAELYAECNRVVASTDRGTVESLLGPAGRHFEARLLELLAEFRKAVVPGRLAVAARLQITTEDNHMVCVRTEGGDAVTLPRRAWAFVKQFDGTRTTSEMVRLAGSVDVDFTPFIAALRAAGVLRELDSVG